MYEKSHVFYLRGLKYDFYINIHSDITNEYTLIPRIKA